MPDNYIRFYELIIGEPTVIGSTGTPKQGVIIRGNNIRFRINKTNDSKLNQLDLTLYNLSQETISIFDKKDVIVELKVWYKGSPPITIFAGETTSCQTKREETEVITSILAAEGFAAAREGRVQLAFPKDTSVKDIISKVMQEGYGGTPVFSKSSEAITSKTYKNGYSASGEAKAVLDKICNTNNLTWDMTFNVYPFNGSTDRKAILLQPWQIKNTPEKISQDVKKLKDDLKLPKETGLKLTTNLNPLLVAGDPVKIEGTFNSDGVYLIESVEHSGEFEGDEWDTTIECSIF